MSSVVPGGPSGTGDEAGVAGGEGDGTRRPERRRVSPRGTATGDAALRSSGGAGAGGGGEERVNVDARYGFLVCVWCVAHSLCL